jgi:hypothetical protein
MTALTDVDIDPATPGFFLRPDYYDVLARLRAEAPVFEFAPGCKAISRYADIRHVSRNPELFCSGRGVLVNDPIREGGTIEGSILHMDPPEPVSTASATSPATVFHLGALNWMPNVEGIKWFTDRVWPLVIHAFPDARLRIAGRSIPPEIYRRQNQTIEVVGEVDDAARLVLVDELLGVVRRWALQPIPG